MSTMSSQRDEKHLSSSSEIKPKAVIFDLLTGLLDSWTLWDSSVPDGSICNGRKWRERYLEITFAQGSYVPYESLVRQAALDVGLPTSVPEQLLQHWHQLKPWPEVPAVLAQLQKAGVRLAVLTNCSEKLGRQAVRDLCHFVQEQTGLDLEFDTVVTAEESGWYKPRRQAYEAGLQALGLPPEDVLFVAGSAGDVEGASRAGMTVVWNNHVGLVRKGSVEPLKEGRSLDEALRGIFDT